MKLRSEFFYIFLVTYYLIDVGEASSNDEGEKSIERERHKWTEDEEVELMFLDLSTDTAKRERMSSIIKEWHKRYPDSNLTDTALRRKIQRIRDSSYQEGRRRKTFKWNVQLDQELVDVYHTTRPYIKDANVSLEEEWRRRYPFYQAKSTYLIWRVRRLFNKYKFLRYRLPGSIITSSLVEDPVEKTHHRWTEHEKARLLHFEKLTSAGGKSQLGSIRTMWREEFPKSNVTDNALSNMLREIRRASREEGFREKLLSGTPEEEKLLLETYLNTYPYRKDVNVTFGEVWKQRQGDSSVEEKYLMHRARKLLIDNRYPEYSARAFFKRKSESYDQHGSQRLDTRRIEFGENEGLPLRESRRESQAGPSRIKSSKRNKLLPKMEKILEGRKEAETEKRFGKAPIAYFSEDSASSSPSMTSEDSE